MGFFRRLLSDKSNHPHDVPSAGPSTNPPPSLPTPPPFQYTPLPSPTTHFRILHLQPTRADLATPWPSIPLRGTLLPCPVSSPPAYHALSYCWGDPTPADTIVLDGAVLRITASCAAALRRMLRGRPRGRKIWVDAICINQAGDVDALAERGAQVAMMDRIYDGAEEVVVHLGEGDAETDAACQAVRKLAVLYAGMTGLGFVAGPFRKKYEALAVDVLGSTPGYPHGLLNGLFRQPWFQRYWVIQEVAFTDKVTFFCGEYRLLMSIILMATDFSHLSPTLLKSTPLASHWRTYTQYHMLVRGWIRRRENQATTVPPPALFEVIVPPALIYDATRPEDKVHALYGICKRLGYDLPAPDYTKSLAAVYTEAAQAILRHDGQQGLDKLLETACPTPSSRDRGIPSWVPDLSSCLRKWSLTNPANLYMNDRKNTCPSGPENVGCEFKPGADPSRLRVKGRRLDIVCESGPPWVVNCTTDILGGAPSPSGDNVADTPSSDVRLIRDLLTSLENWFAIVLRSMNATLPSHAPAAGLRLAELLGKDTKRNPSADVLKDLARHLATAMTIWKRHPGDPYPLYLTETIGPQDYVKYGDATMSRAMYAHLNPIIQGMAWKTVFRTAQGHVGVGPYSVKEGDMVVVFQRCSMAGLVRPTQGGYSYVGPAYVLGVMHGEFWERGKAGDDEWFELV